MNLMKEIPCILALTFPLLCGAEPLSDQLEQRKAEFLQKADPEKAAKYEEGIEAVAASGVVDKALKKGDEAPDFELPNAAGKTVRLSELLAEGPVVLTWYRGGWCPYCNLALRAMQIELLKIQETGAQLVAISPELPQFAEETKTKNALEFEVLTDEGNAVARKFGIVFKMTPYVAKAMQDGAKLHERNGDESDELPLAATYVIKPNGKIAYAFLDPDYRKRAEPSEVVEVLKEL